MYSAVEKSFCVFCRNCSFWVVIQFTWTKMMISVVLICVFGLGNVSANEPDGNLTDPTKPATIFKSENLGMKQTGSSFKLSQIYISAKKRFAIINGQQVETGDLIAGAEVKAIKSDRVHLLIDGLVTQIAIMPSIKQY